MVRRELWGSPEEIRPLSESLADIVEYKFEAHPEYVKVFLAGNDQIFETLTLGKSYLQREMLPSGNRAATQIYYQELEPGVWRRSILLGDDGKWRHVFGDEDFYGNPKGKIRAGDQVSAFQQGIITARILFGRPKQPVRWPGEPSIEDYLEGL